MSLPLIATLAYDFDELLPVIKRADEFQCSDIGALADYLMGRRLNEEVLAFDGREYLPVKPAEPVSSCAHYDSRTYDGTRFAFLKVDLVIPRSRLDALRNEVMRLNRLELYDSALDLIEESRRKGVNDPALELECARKALEFGRARRDYAYYARLFCRQGDRRYFIRATALLAEEATQGKLELVDSESFQVAFGNQYLFK